MAKQGELRVWWIPQVPMKPFHVSVGDVEEAIRFLIVLAEYDLFQFHNRIKPDYCNTGGLEVFEDGEWYEWESFDGDSVNDIIRERDLAKAEESSKLEAAEKMAEALKLMRECRHMKNCAGCTVRISESLAAWESTL